MEKCEVVDGDGDTVHGDAVRMGMESREWGEDGDQLSTTYDEGDRNLSSLQ